MGKLTRKYILTASIILLCAHMVFGAPFSRISAAGEGQQPPELNIVVPPPGIDTTGVNLNAPSAIVDPAEIPDYPDTDNRRQYPPDYPEDPERRIDPDSIPETGRFLPDSYYETDTVGDVTIFEPVIMDSVLRDSLENDTLQRPRENKNFLDDVISGKNKDSLVYDLRNKMVYIYDDGDITYQDMNLKADYIEVDMVTKNIYGYGVTDSLGVKSRPEFIEGGSSYTMDTLAYNIDSKKAKVKGAATKEGDGYLIGNEIKKMNDNTVNIAGGKYTTCDHVDHPHFYLAMTKAKLIPGKKVIIGPSYLVLEDVPIYFPLLPFGFFPVTSGRSSGFIIPSYGEEYVKGFFLRDGGYYFAFNDYIDMTVLGGFYTLGSWESSLSSRYIKRYKYSGGFNLRFSKDIIGEKGSADYVNMSNFNIQWTHTQDPKFRPNSTFSASVNFGTSGYSKYGAQNMNDHLNTQTSSSISYSKSWPGKPFSFSTSMQHSQNSRNKTISLTFPSAVFNVSRIYPLKRRNPIGKERWYEKISMSYTGSLTNTVTVDEKDFLTQEMLSKMNSGINHSIPISSSFTLFNYLNVTPSVNYTERWYFKKITREWDPVENTIIYPDTTYGFYRLYNYSVSASATTKVYGDFVFGQNFPIRQIRHVLTPNISVNYTPDFGDPKYGFYQPYQRNADGDIDYYVPYTGPYGSPGRGQSASIGFGISNTLEAKVRSDRDTTGVRKIKIIDELRFSSSYNLLADSLNLSPIAAVLRTTIIKNFGLNVNATFDPYQINDRGVKINKFMIRKGKLARLTSASTSFGYTFNSTKTGQPAINDITSGAMLTPEQTDFFANNNITDPNVRRMMMTSQYYDFNIPWNIGFSYTFNYSAPGLTKTITQSINFNGSITPTEKWGFTFGGGYNFQERKLTPGVVTVTRDLHCWQMNLSWVPTGTMKSWSFNISVKSAVLRDLKWDKRSSRYDTLYD